MIAARLGEQRAVEFMFVYRRPILASRSSAGVGITPPKVLAAPKPVSSVMISRTFGAPLGGTTRGGHHGLDWRALRSIVPIVAVSCFAAGVLPSRAIGRAH